MLKTKGSKTTTLLIRKLRSLKKLILNSLLINCALRCFYCYLTIYVASQLEGAHEGMNYEMNDVNHW